MKEKSIDEIVMQIQKLNEEIERIEREVEGSQTNSLTVLVKHNAVHCFKQPLPKQPLPKQCREECEQNTFTGDLNNVSGSNNQESSIKSLDSSHV